MREQPVESAVASLEKMAPRKAMNSTAYRIFKLLQWLIQSPLSVEALNRRFCEEPLIGKPVSNDSIWLYINTLKALGCKIRRPSPKNNFQYEMLSHPFGITLSESQLEALSQAKAFAQQQFSHQEMLVLDGLLRKVVAFSTTDEPQRMIERLFAQSRSYDYAGLESHIQDLEQWIVDGQLLWMTYLSPAKGQEQFYFLPESLFYEQGVVYVRGERPEFPGPSRLRVDRVLNLQTVMQEELKNSLLARKSHMTEVVLRVMLPVAPQESVTFGGFRLSEYEDVYRETIIQIDGPAGSFSYEIQLDVRDVFYLKQRLLACGLPFRVLMPESFRMDMQETLQSMLAFYQTNGGHAHGHG